MYGCDPDTLKSLWLNDLGDLVDVQEDVFHPEGVFGHDVEAGRLALAGPVIDVLVIFSEFGGDRWDAELGKNVVVGVAAHLLAHDLSRIAKLGVLREYCVLLNVVK